MSAHPCCTPVCDVGWSLRTIYDDPHSQKDAQKSEILSVLAWTPAALDLQKGGGSGGFGGIGWVGGGAAGMGPAPPQLIQ